MYIPAHSIRIRDERIVFHTSIMEIVEALCHYGRDDNGIDYDSVIDVFDYRFMFEYNERGNARINSFSKGLFSDKRWNDLIVALNKRICNMSARIVYVNERKHIALNNVIVTLFGEDELELGYDYAIEEFISYFQETDVEEIGGRIYDVESFVHSFNAFSRYVRKLNE